MLRQLLKLTLTSLIESLRKDPTKFHALYYNMSSSSAKSPSSSSSPPTTTSDGNHQQYDYVPFMNEQDLSIDYSNEEICMKMLLDESEGIYDKMVEDLTNKTISDLTCDSELLSSLARKELSDIQKDSTHRLAAYTYRREDHTFIQWLML